MTFEDRALSDAELVAASWTDPDRFAAVYDRHAGEIHRFTARRLGVGAADDITADVFLTAFRTRERYDTTRPSARPWLYGIAANLIGKRRRSEVRGLRALARTGRDPVAESWVEQTEDRVVAQASQGVLAAALAALSTGDRDVLLLVAWGDLTYVEVADALVIPVGTVRSRLNRARRQVRLALSPDPEPDPDSAPHAPSAHPTEKALRHG